MKVELSLFALALFASQAKHVSAAGGIRNLEPLNFVGDVKHPKYSLGECMGDCDRDKHCEFGLVCFQRNRANTVVPGCSGLPTDSVDYCVKPEANQLVLMGDNGSPSNAFPLQACQGDCDSDSDCAGSLKCFERAGTEEVPGCIGKGQRRSDYCYDDSPPDTPAPTSSPTATPVTSSPTEAPVTPVTSSPTASPVSDNTLVIAGDDGSPSAAFPLGKCEGDCDGDSDCSGNLKCFQRSGTEAVPGCEGSGVSGKDYCFDVPEGYLWEMGNDGLPEDAFPLGLCQGDCDNDDECQEGLVCMQRSADESVPGCDGAGETGTDYCIADSTNPPGPPGPPATPSPTKAPTTSSDVLTIVGDNGSPSAAFPLGKCEGDCDRDSDCSGAMKCFQRGGTEAVPGCEGSGVSGKDYCFEVLPGWLMKMGNDGLPEDVFPLARCQGDCDSDDECQEGLYCMQRSADEEVPGCIGTATYGTDYCVAPATGSPTITSSPTRAPVEGEVTYVPGEATVYENGLILSTGLTSRIIATKNTKVPYHNGGESSESFHSAPDGAAVFQKPGSCEYAYVSNSEASTNGGVGAIYFDCEGRVTEYRRLLSGTRRNCGGGKTPWGTWLSGEEYDNGQIWEVDPWGGTESRPTVMGGAGDDYESAAYDNRDPSNPVFFATVDNSQGPLVKYTPPTNAVQDALATGDYSNLLHTNGAGQNFEYFKVLSIDESTGTGTYTWTENREEGQNSAATYHPYGEGIDIVNGMLHYTVKTTKMLWIIDLDNFTFVRSSTQSGAFDGQPDQVARILDGGDAESILYFCEDGSNDAGIHARNAEGNFYTIVKDPGTYNSETTGLALSPDHMKMYVSYQVPGIIFEFTRTDGYPFSGQVLDIKYHEDDTNSNPFTRHLQAENEKTCDIVYEAC